MCSATCVLCHPKSSILVSSDQTIFSQYFTGLSKCCPANFKRASTWFFFSNGILRGEHAYRPRRLSALLIVFFETIVPANSRSFWSWSLALGQLFLSTPEILRGAPGRGRFMVKWCSFHFRIMAPTVLTGTFRSYEILLLPMPSVCFATKRLQWSWESSLLLPIMRCFLCDTLGMRHILIGHQFDCFLMVSWLSMPFWTSLSLRVQYLFYPLYILKVKVLYLVQLFPSV